MLISIASRKRGLAFVLPVIALAFALAAAACSDDGDGGGTQTTTAEEIPAATTTDVSLGDFFIDPGELSAGPGDPLTFNITNDGSATHNLRIAGPDGEFETEDDAVVAPVEEGGLAPGDTASLQWTTPSEPGTINFRCDFHPTQMTGTISVGG